MYTMLGGVNPDSPDKAHRRQPNDKKKYCETKILLLNQLNIEENIYNDRIKKCKVVIENKSLPSQGRD